MNDTPSTLPASVEAERSILGAILLDNHAYTEASELLEVQDFSLDSHRRIYARMADLAESNRPVDMVTLVEELDGHKDLGAVGDVGYVSSLIEGVPERPSIAHYVEIVRNKAALRRLVIASNATAARACEPGADALAIARDLDGLITSIGGKLPSRARHISDVLRDTLNHMQAERDRNEAYIGIPTGIGDLDDALGGIRESELWILGVCPEMVRPHLECLTACQPRR